MGCYYPIEAYRSSDGKVYFNDLHRVKSSFTFCLPCGQCVGCRLERSRQWAVRCVHEASMYKDNSFVTLTYDDEHLPADSSLDYRHFQLFMKKLRKEYRVKIRYFVCGEYGGERGRPHYHAIIFNLPVVDRVFFKKSDSGSNVYTSEWLSRIWGNGFVSCGDVSFESAAYVARYVMKKVTGESAKSHYLNVDLATGELLLRQPEFCHCSLKPGIGSAWYEKFKSDVFPGGFVIMNGVKCNPPKFYTRKYAASNPEEFAVLSVARDLHSRTTFPDNTRERLIVKEKVTNAKVSFLKRNI